jgi:hypothetical protein
VGSGNIDVGKAGQPSAERVAVTDRSSKSRIEKPGLPKTERPGNCGAMVQQCADNGGGNRSAPQKFLQLVGYRDPMARPRPAPVKR